MCCSIRSKARAFQKENFTGAASFAGGVPAPAGPQAPSASSIPPPAVPPSAAAVARRRVVPVPVSAIASSPYRSPPPTADRRPPTADRRPPSLVVPGPAHVAVTQPPPVYTLLRAPRTLGGRRGRS